MGFREASAWRTYGETQPLRFFDRDLLPHLAHSCYTMAQFVGANPSIRYPLIRPLGMSTRRMAAGWQRRFIQLVVVVAKSFCCVTCINLGVYGTLTTGWLNVPANNSVCCLPVIVCLCVSRRFCACVCNVAVKALETDSVCVSGSVEGRGRLRVLQTGGVCV